MQQNNPISVESFNSSFVTYSGKKEDLIAAGIADEEDFPVWPKRNRNSGSGPRHYYWSVRYVKGGSFEVTHRQIYGGAEDMLPFVAIADGRVSYWDGDPGVTSLLDARAAEERAIGKLYFIALMRYLRKLQRSIFYRLLEEILEDMPEYSWRVGGFKEAMGEYLLAAATIFDIDRTERELKAELLAKKAA